MLTQCVGFIKARHIEFCMMLCKELSEDDKKGVTFKCIKDCYNMLDIIELEKTSSEDFEDEDLFNPSGYDEFAQALRSVIWSNVDVNHGKENKINRTIKVFSFFSLQSVNEWKISSLRQVWTRERRKCIKRRV